MVSPTVENWFSCIIPQKPLQVFIQAILLMFVFEQRLSFQMIYFKTNDHEITVKCKWGSGGALSSTVSLWRSIGVGSGGKGSEKFCSFYIRRANK